MLEHGDQEDVVGDVQQHVGVDGPQCRSAVVGVVSRGDKVGACRPAHQTAVPVAWHPLACD